MSHQSTRPLWVYFLLNGDDDRQNGVKVNISTISDLSTLFTKATESLNLHQLDATAQLQLQRVFSSDGIEIHAIDQIYPDDYLYFSCGEDYFRPSELTPEQQQLLQQQQQQQAQQQSPQNGEESATGNGYLYTAAVFSAGLLSTTYGAFSHAVRTHASQRVINTFNSIEEGVQYYSNPVVQTTLPYISSGITWSDQMLNQTIAVTTQKTNEFLQTPTGQKMTQLKDNVADYTSKAVTSFQQATSGNNNAASTTGDNTDVAQQQQQNYLQNFKEAMGHQWNDVLAPWALATYHSLHEQFNQQQSNAPNSTPSSLQQQQQPQQQQQQQPPQ